MSTRPSKPFERLMEMLPKGFCRERAMEVFLLHKRDQWSTTDFLLQELETAGGEDEMETSDDRSGAPVAPPPSLPQQPCGKSTSPRGK